MLRVYIKASELGNMEGKQPWSLRGVTQYLCIEQHYAEPLICFTLLMEGCSVTLASFSHVLPTGVISLFTPFCRI